MTRSIPWAKIEAARAAGRALGTMGGCHWMAMMIEDGLGWQAVRGYYNSEGVWYQHSWNLLPDGRILDATADQFGEPGDGIRITAADDRRYAA